jgi:hypothetical protein
MLQRDQDVRVKDPECLNNNNNNRTGDLGSKYNKDKDRGNKQIILNCPFQTQLH